MRLLLAILLGTCVPLTGCGPGLPACAPGEDTTIDLDGNGVADCSETLVKNSQLVQGITGFTAGVEALVAADTEDARGKAGSGSLRVTNQTKTNAPTIRAGTQCIPLVPEARYVVAGNFRIVTAGVSGIGAQIAVRHFAAAGCAGGEMNAQVTSIDMTGGAWAVLQTTITAPRALSAYFEASVRKNGVVADAVVLFDNLLIHGL